MTFGAPTVNVDAHIAKDAIQVSQSQSGGAKKILTDATGAITGIEPT
jgi:hypothetical protein